MHIEFGLPGLSERLEILMIHTQSLRNEGMIAAAGAGAVQAAGAGALGAGAHTHASDDDGVVGDDDGGVRDDDGGVGGYLASLSRRMEGFSGAEIEATVLGAVSFALERITYGALHHDNGHGRDGAEACAGNDSPGGAAVSGAGSESGIEGSVAGSSASSVSVRFEDFERSFGEIRRQKQKNEDMKQKQLAETEANAGGGGCLDGSLISDPVELELSAGGVRSLRLGDLSSGALVELEGRLFVEKTKRAMDGIAKNQEGFGT